MYWVFTISIGMFQFGFAMLVMNPFLDNLWVSFKCGENDTIYKTTLTTGVPLGAFFGSIICGWLIKFGRRKMLLITNMMLTISILYMLVSQDFYSFVISRFMYGISVGSFSWVWSVFVKEIVPVKDAGFFGAFNQFMITAGIMVASIFGLLSGSHSIELTYRLVFSFPLLLITIQVFLLLCYFQNESPEYYDDMRMVHEQLSTYKLIYQNSKNSICQNIDDENFASGSISDLDDNAFKTMNPKSLLIGITLAFLQQLTGINAVIFYSSQIFSPKDENGNTLDDQNYSRIGTLMVGVVNWVSSAAGIFMMYRFKRKTLLYNGMVWMAIWLSFLSFVSSNTTLQILFSLLFLVWFELSIGNILWLYLAEILLPREVGISIAANWIGVIIMSILSLLLFKNVKPKYVYLIFASFCSVGIVFILLLIKETHGLTSKQCKRLYFPERKYDSGQNYSVNNDDDETEILISSNSAEHYNFEKRKTGSMHNSHTSDMIP